MNTRHNLLQDQASSLPALFGKEFQLVLQATGSESQLCWITTCSFLGEDKCSLVVRDHSELTEHIRRQPCLTFFMPLPEGGFIEGVMDVSAIQRVQDNVIVSGAVKSWKPVPQENHQVCLQT